MKTYRVYYEDKPGSRDFEVEAPGHRAAARQFFSERPRSEHCRIVAESIDWLDYRDFDASELMDEAERARASIPPSPAGQPIPERCPECGLPYSHKLTCSRVRHLYTNTQGTGHSPPPQPSPPPRVSPASKATKFTPAQANKWAETRKRGQKYYTIGWGVCFRGLLALIGLLAVTLLLCGCATAPISTSKAHAVPPERVLSSAYLTQRPGTCLVIVKRDTGILGSPCSSRVFVDSHPVAELATGEKVSLYLIPGEHIIGADSKACAGGLPEASIFARPDRPAALRIRYGTNGDFSIQPTAM